MVDATVSMVLKKLTPLIEKKVKEEVCLLLNAKDEAKSLTPKLMKIHQVLADADRKGVTDPRVKSWLDQLQEIAYEIDDVLDEWEMENLKQQLEEESEDASRSSEDPWQKVSSFLESVCLCFKQTVQRRSIALDIKRINKRLDSVAQENENEFKFIPNIGGVSRDFKRIESTSFVEVSDIRGRDSDKEMLMSKLLSESSGQGEDKFKIISIVGAGGMGKTTLAQFVFNEIKKQNEFKPIWVCVSDPFDEIKIAHTILNELGGGNPANSQFETLLQCIVRSIATIKIFLVLDDVWTENDTMWIPLKKSLESGEAGSRILLTTRNEKVAKVMGSNDMNIHSLRPLSDSDCWSILSQKAFQNRRDYDLEMLRETGLKIAKKCKGMPLAAKIMGGLLRFKSGVQEWQNVLKSEMWEEKVREGIFPFLRLSYDVLNPAVKRCFSYCAIFQKDSIIHIDDLIRMWMAQGFLSSSETMELQGREYFEDLAMRSFFQDFELSYRTNSIKSCKMHDIVHDFAQFLTKNECLIVGEAHGGQSIAAGHDARHLRLMQSQERTDFSFFPQLRSFFCKNIKVPPYLFNHLKRVRLLSLRNLKNIPEEIGNLIHIRYLDVSKIPSLKELPETVCNLYNLQTLGIRVCRSLCGLPEGIHKLKNLRHLLNIRTALDFKYPEGFEKLTNLRTLDQYCSNKLGYLKDLNQLQGSLHIKVMDEVEVKKADLKNKIFLQRLVLEVEGDELLEIMEDVHPPPNLEQLFFEGHRLPKWCTTLTQLRELQFSSSNTTYDGGSWSLPPLGKLPFLEELRICEVQTVDHVGHELLGMMNDKTSTVALIIFPKLKILKFSRCWSWKEWEDISEEEEEENNMIFIMPCLQELQIYECSELKALPHRLLHKASSLQVLDIYDCPYLKDRYNRETGEDWDKVSHISKVQIDSTPQ